VYNNPQRYTDPNGHVVLVDDLVIGGAVIGTAAAITYLQSKEGKESTRAFIQGTELLINKAASALGNLIFNESTDRGRANEQKGLDAAGAEKNTKPISATDPKTGREGTTIPDRKKADGQLVEVKDTKRVTDSGQLRLQNEASKQSSGKPSEVVTGEKTKVSKTVQREHPVRRITELGPQQ